MKKKYKFLWLVVCLGLGLLRAEGQGGFAYRAFLDTVRADGFYRILLTPELIVKCRPDLGDIRILGPNQRFVPYVLEGPGAANDPGTQWRAIPGAEMAQKDSINKHTYVTVTWPEAYEIDIVIFNVGSPVFFKREAEIRAEGPKPGEWTKVSTVTVDPKHLMLKIPTVRTRRLWIDIDNADNAPLALNEVAGLEAARFLLAYLRPGFTYQVFAGNAQVSPPDYDLKYFTDSVKGTAPTLLLDSLQRIGIVDQPKVINGVSPAQPPVSNGKTPASSSASPRESSILLLWSVIFVVLLLLIYFSVKMVRAIAQKDTHDRL
jgi:hypothetical protein